MSFRVAVDRGFVDCSTGLIYYQIMHGQPSFIDCLVKLGTYNTDQLRVFNCDVDVPVPKPLWKVNFSIRLWQPQRQRKHKQDKLRQQPHCRSIKDMLMLDPLSTKLRRYVRPSATRAFTFGDYGDMV